MLFSHKLDHYSLNLETYIEEMERGNLNFIPWIFCVFAGNSPEHKLRAARALKRISKMLSFSAICQIDMQMRQTTSMEWGIDWRTLSVEDFITEQMSSAEKRVVLLFSSFNPNGYIREQAVRLLGSYELTLPYIILRLNDWVEPVRQTALLSFSRKIKTADGMEILKALPFLEKLRRSERCAYSSIESSFLQEMSSIRGKSILENGLKSHEIFTRKLCYHLLLNTQELDCAIGTEYLNHETDPFLRKGILMALIKMNMDVSDLARQCLKDKYPANRVIALQYLYDHKRDCVLQNAEDMLLDKNAFARQLARRIVQNLNSSFDVHKLYLENLEEHPHSAILGLGETGDGKDCALIERYLQARNVSVIRAAMIALMRLDPQKYGFVITELLLSEHQGIVKTAKLLIEKYGTYDFERIFDISQLTSYENTKVKCVALLFSSSKWQRLIYMLHFLSSEYESVQTLCIVKIRTWINYYNRSYMAPTEKQKQVIRELVGLAEKYLSKRVQEQLLFFIK